MIDDELMEALKSEIDQDLIVIHKSDEPYVEMIEDHFPIGFNRIDWEKRPPLMYLDLKAFHKMEWETQINLFFQTLMAEFPGIGDEMVAVFGDGATNYAYEMKFSVFVKNSAHFLKIAQHHYIVFLESHRCFNATMERELIFG
jgi:hypothetical protein